MAVVDRNILRIAAWEIIFNDDVPDRVAIDEALGLAKTLSDGDSGVHPRPAQRDLR